jgi:precorrin-8X/cobalt-precorrin-8 methylmutase
MQRDGLILLTGDEITASLTRETVNGNVWRRYGELLPQLPARAVVCAPDSLKAAVKELAAAGCTGITVLPLGGNGDTSQIAADSLPGVTLTLAPQLSLSPQAALETTLADQILHGLDGAAPAAYADYAERVKDPADIERRSLNFIDGLLDGLPFSSEERAVATRVVHAGGDSLLAHSLAFRSGAVKQAVDSVRAGVTIYTDVNMLAAGINRRITERFGCRVVCALDQPGVAARAEADAVTRSRAAFEMLGHALDGALIAVGNAPTALLAVLDLIKAGRAAPGCIIGMPVGFVQARESKERLYQSDIPYITLRGFRGGSALAAAAVNAIRVLAERDA